MSLVWTLLAGVSLILWDCATAIVGDPLSLCPTVAGMGLPEPLSVAWALLGICLVGLVTAWIPHLDDRSRRRSAKPEHALLANIGRLPDPYSEYLVELETFDPVVELSKAVGVVETAFATDSTATRDMTAEWMRLLLEANRLHNDGALSTEEFKTLNTRLLEAVVTPVGADSSI